MVKAQQARADERYHERDQRACQVPLSDVMTLGAGQRRMPRRDDSTRHRNRSHADHFLPSCHPDHGDTARTIDRGIGAANVAKGPGDEDLAIRRDLRLYLRRGRPDTAQPPARSARMKVRRIVDWCFANADSEVLCRLRLSYRREPFLVFR